MKSKIMIVISLSLLAFSTIDAGMQIPTNNRLNVIPNSYIVQVVDTDDVYDVAAKVERFSGGAIGHIYTHALWGFSIHVPPHIRPIDVLSQAGIIKVEPNLKAYLVAQKLPTGVDRIDVDLNTTAKIDGIDERVDVDIAIIDTGIDVDHPDLPEVVDGVHFWTVTTGPPWNRGTFSDGNYDDDDGHGSHVAGIAAAIDNGIGVVGVAPGARLWAVKVFTNGAGTVADVIAGVDWVTSKADLIEIANLSLSWQGNSESARTSIQNSVGAGVVYVAAAGNDSTDVYGTDGVLGTSDDFEPASYPEVATISAMADSDGQPDGTGGSTSYGADDSFASFSNYNAAVTADNPVSSSGAAIDLLLPGVDIHSCYKNGGYAIGSGTSMSSPHAAGLAALYIAVNSRDADGDGDHDADDVYIIRQALIDDGVTQSDPQYGLTVQNDPDSKRENIGWAGPIGPTASVSISPSSQSGKGFPGDIVSYTFTVTNTGELDDTYNLSTSSTWDSSVIPTSLSLNSGQSSDVIVEHTVPIDASVGMGDSGTLTSNSADTGASDNASFTTTVQGYAVDVTPDSQSNSAAPGDTVTYTYTVTNTGTEQDSFNLSTTSMWSSSVSPTSLTLAGGESSQVTVNHTIPETAQDGDTDTGTLSIVSPNASDSSTFATSATVNIGVIVESITPNSMQAGSTIDITITGSGFAPGADVTFENGSGPAPAVSNVVVEGTNTINATVTAKSGGPPRNRVWDVLVTNLDFSTGVLVDGFTVTP